MAICKLLEKSAAVTAAGHNFRKLQANLSHCLEFAMISSPVPLWIYPRVRYLEHMLVLISINFEQCSYHFRNAVPLCVLTCSGQGSNFSTFSAILTMFSFLLFLFNHSHPKRLLGTCLYVSLGVCTCWGTCIYASACTCVWRSERVLSILRCSLPVSMSQCVFLNFEFYVSTGLDASQPQQSSELELQSFAGTSGLLHGC